MPNTVINASATGRTADFEAVVPSSGSTSPEKTSKVAQNIISGLGKKKLGRPRKLNAKSRDIVRYRSWTGYLVRDTVAEAGYELERTAPNGTRDGRDLSDLIQDLLTDWIAEKQQFRMSSVTKRPSHRA